MVVSVDSKVLYFVQVLKMSKAWPRIWGKKILNIHQEEYSERNIQSNLFVVEFHLTRI